MKKTALMFILLAAATMAWAQEEPVVPPTLDEVQAAVDSVDQKTVGLYKNTTDALTGLDGRIKALESKLQLSGYLAASIQYFAEPNTVQFYDASPENSRFRLNLAYTDKLFKIASRLQFRPLKGNVKGSGTQTLTGTVDTTVASTTAPVTISQVNFSNDIVDSSAGILDLAYLDGYARLFNLVELHAGKTLIKDYSTVFGYMGEIGSGYYEGAWGYHVGLNPSAFVPGLRVGLFVPVDYLAAGDTWTTSLAKADLNLTYRVAGLFDINAGYLGQDWYKDAAGAGSFSDYFKSDSTTPYINTAYIGGAYYGLPVVTAVKALYQYTHNYNAGYSVQSNILVTAAGEFMGFKFANDFYGTQPQDDGKKTLTTTSFRFQNNFLGTYLIKAIDKDLDLEPGLQVRYETQPDAAADNAKSMLSFNPRVKFISGKQELLIGYDYQMAADTSTNKFIDAKNKDNNLSRVHFGYKINF